LHLLSDPLAPVMRLMDLLPRGRSLPEHLWVRRHHALLTVLWLHVAGLACLGYLRGYGIHTALDSGILAAFAAGASLPNSSRRLRSIMVALGLLSSSALIVHLTGGLIESHFHFFVIVPLLTLYSDWSVFLLAIGFVAVHHGVFGMLEPHAVFAHPEAWKAPWKWALIHATYVLAASGAALVAWRATEERALCDSLTQLANAESFLEQTNRALARAARRGEHVGVLCLDLDGFKKINDTFGHAAGDALLVGVAQRLQGLLRSSDIAARFGGDEFAVLLENVETLKGAQSVASRLLEAIDEPFEVKSRPVHVSGSLGIAVSDSKRHRGSEALLKEADDAMYTAKISGKGGYRISPNASSSLRPEVRPSIP
jgi:diguanylate cyclase (GGDEF)-like protein